MQPLLPITREANPDNRHHRSMLAVYASVAKVSGIAAPTEVPRGRRSLTVPFLGKKTAHYCQPSPLLGAVACRGVTALGTYSIVPNLLFYV